MQMKLQSLEIAATALMAVADNVSAFYATCERRRSDFPFCLTAETAETSMDRLRRFMNLSQRRNPAPLTTRVTFCLRGESEDKYLTF